MKANKGGAGIPPLILNLDTRWRSVVNFTHRPLHPGNEPRHPLNRRLGGPKACLGVLQKGKNILSLPQSII